MSTKNATPADRLKRDYDRYIARRDEKIRQIGEVLACEFPKMTGKVEFNIYQGTMVKCNFTDGIKGKADA
jgi:hypothetical protein